MLRSPREFGYNSRVAQTAHHAGDAESWRAEGADLVLMPFVDAAKEAADVLIGQLTARETSSVVTNSVEEE